MQFYHFLQILLLTDEPVKILKVPNINDAVIINKRLAELGRITVQEQNCISISVNTTSIHPHYELVGQIQASFLIMGSLLARRGK